MSDSKEIQELREEVRELKYILLGMYAAIEKGNNPLSLKSEITSQKSNMVRANLTLKDLTS